MTSHGASPYPSDMSPDVEGSHSRSKSREQSRRSTTVSHLFGSFKFEEESCDADWATMTTRKSKDYSYRVEGRNSNSDTLFTRPRSAGLMANTPSQTEPLTASVEEESSSQEDESREAMLSGPSSSRSGSKNALKILHRLQKSPYGSRRTRSADRGSAARRTLPQEEVDEQAHEEQHQHKHQQPPIPAVHHDWAASLPAENQTVATSPERHSIPENADDPEFAQIEQRAKSTLQLVASQQNNMDSSSIVEYTLTLQEYRRACARRGNYRAADIVHHVIRHLRNEEENRHISSLTEQHRSELREVEDCHQQEFSNFHAIWNRRIDKFESESLDLEMELLEKQTLDWRTFYAEMGAPPPASTTRLTRRQHDAQFAEYILANQHEYYRAAQKRALLDMLTAAQATQTEQERIENIAKEEAKLTENHQRQLGLLNARVEKRRLALERSRKRELELLLKRYTNLKTHLESKQNIILAKTGVILHNHANNNRSDLSGSAALVASMASGAFGSSVQRRALEGLQQSRDATLSNQDSQPRLRKYE